MSGLARLMRSRKLAALLIGLLAIYSFIGTLVPLGGPEDEAVRAWVSKHPVAASIAGPLGLHHAFTSPVFLVLLGLLVVSTSLCAIERTRRALRVRRSLVGGSGSGSVARRLGERPDAVARLQGGSDPERNVDAVTEKLAALGFRVRVDDRFVTGVSGIPALAASPAFHWSIVALIIAILIGQATGAAGYVGLPLREPVVEAHDSYLQTTEGPFFGERHTGVVLELLELRRDYKSKGVEYGVVPRTRVFKDDVEVASGYVHQNHPMRVGPLMIHAADYGPTAVMAIETSSGAEIARNTLLLDRSEETSSGTVPKVFVVRASEQEAPYRVRVQVIRRASSSDIGRAMVEIAPAGDSQYGTPQILNDGEFIELPSGSRLRLAKVSDWSRVRIANDASLPVVYALMSLMTVALAVAILIPTKCVRVLVPEAGGSELHVSAWHSRRQPGFLQSTVDALERIDDSSRK